MSPVPKPPGGVRADSPAWVTAPAVKALAASEPASALLSSSASADELLEAAKLYADKAEELGLPPELWTLQTRGPHILTPILRSPLLVFGQLKTERPQLAPAAAFLAKAGAPLWGASWEAHHVLVPLETPPHPGLAAFILSSGPSPLRRLYLQLALADPLAPRSFMKDLRSAYAESLSQATAAPGVLGPADETLLALSELLISCEPELLAASKRQGWSSARLLAADAQKRLALKQRPGSFNAPAFLATVSEATRQRLEALCLIIERFPSDEGLIVAALEASPWLKDQPALASLRFPDHRSALSSALNSGSSAALQWLLRSGADPWLAAAQDGEPDACHWAMTRIGRLPPDTDLSSLALALLRDSALSAAPYSQKRRLRLINDTRDSLRRSGHLSEGYLEAADRFVAAAERHAIGQGLAPANASAPPRRSAL